MRAYTYEHDNVYNIMQIMCGHSFRSLLNKGTFERNKKDDTLLKKLQFSKLWKFCE